MDSVQAPQGDGITHVEIDTGEMTSANLELEVQKLNMDIASLRDRLSKLSEASLRISEGLDSDGVLQQVIDSARFLTLAKYGVLLTYNDSGEILSVSASGLTHDEVQQVGIPPSGLGLLGYLNEVDEPVRIADISSHPRSEGFPKNHPPMKTFLGMQVRNGGQHVGNIFLTEKQGGEEFTQDDEETLVLFASQAAQAISNARRYEEVQRTKANLETLFNISPMGIVAFDIVTGDIISYNQEILRLFGGRQIVEAPWQESLLRMSFWRVDGREIPLADLPINRVYQFGETLRAEELVMQMPEGQPVPVLLNGAPIYSEQGDITAAMFTVQDMTSLVDLERVRAEFLGMVSEELRMPLTAIKGSVAALSDIVSLSEQTEPQQLLRIINQQADLMRGQVNSLIELTQISTGTLSISQEVAEVSDLLNDAIREFLRGHAGSAIETHLADGLPQVMADKQRLGLVMNNLFFTVSRHASDLSSIKVSASPVDIYVAISVSTDNVSTYSVEHSQLLIQEILGSQAQDVRRVSGGENLALASCKGIVEAHGGRLRVENDDHAGRLTITFTIPATEELKEDIIADTSLHVDTKGAAEKHTARIMLAIDDPRELATVRQTISGEGYTSISGYNLDDLDRVYEEEKPDLLLLDLSSRRGGRLQTMRRLSEGYDVPIIVLSGSEGEENIGLAFEMGADDYIVKPFSPTELIARIKSTLRKQAAYQRGSGVSNGYTVADVSVNYDARTLNVSGSQVQLTATEYKLLYELSKNAGRILTQDELLHRVWGAEYIGEPQLLRSYVKSLRQKLGDNARSPSYIFTEHGIGYRMAKP